MRRVCRIAAAVILSVAWALPEAKGEDAGLEARRRELAERFDSRMQHSAAASAIRAANAATSAANDFIVNNDGFGGTSSQSQIRIGRQPDGGTIAVWTDDRDANLSVYGQIFDSLGVPLGPNFRLHSDPNNLDQFDPALIIRPDGGFYGAYTQRKLDGDRDVIVQRYSRLGQRLGSAVNVSQNPNNFLQRKPALAMFSNGDLLVVFERDSLGANTSVFGQVFTADDLNRRGPAVAIAADLTIGSLSFIYDEREPAVAIGGKDTVWVAWTDNRDGGVRDVFAQRLHRSPIDTTRKIGPAFKVNDEPLAANTFQKTPQVAVAKDGRALIAWADFRNGNWDIFQQHYSKAAVKTGVNALVNFTDASGADQVDPYMAWADSTGVVVWKDFREGAARTYAQRFHADGGATAVNFPVGPSGAPSQLAPACGTLADGSFSAGWTAQNGQRNEAYYRIVSAANVLGSVQMTAEIIISAKQVRPVSAMTATREVFSAWEESRAALPNIVGQALTSALTKPQGDQQINGGRSTFHFVPSTAVGAGTGFVVWEDYRDTILPVYSDIYLQRYTLGATGYTASGGNVRVIDTVESQEVRLASWDPDVAADDAGNAMVVWQDNRFTSWDVFAARYSATSTDPATGSALRIGRNFRVDQAPALTKQRLPRIDMNGTGQTVVVWEDTRSGDYAFQVWGRVYTGAGATPLGNEFRLLLDPLHIPRQPDVAMASDGSFAVVYEDHSALGDVDVFFQRFTSTGDTIPGVTGDPILINDDGLSVNQYLPKIAAISGGYVVVWQDERAGNWDIYAAFVPNGAAAADANYLVNDPNITDQTAPSIAGIRSSNEPFICWEDLRQTTTAPDIFGNRNAPSLATGIGDDSHDALRPEAFELAQNFPNPFNPATEIRFALAAPGRVNLVIFNTLGQRVRTLVDETRPAGESRIVWDGLDEGGRTVASGTYFYRLAWPGGDVTRKMTLLR